MIVIRLSYCTPKAVVSFSYCKHIAVIIVASLEATINNPGKSVVNKQHCLLNV